MDAEPPENGQYALVGERQSDAPLDRPTRTTTASEPAYRLMMLWISITSGGPASSTPLSVRIGIRRSPNASNCSLESQISLTRKLPPALNATCNSSPSGGNSPEGSMRVWVASYLSAVKLGAAVKRTRMLMCVPP